MSKGSLTVVVGGLFGSLAEAKGATCAWLAQPARFGAGLAVRIGGPNAGHVAVDQTGQRWALRQVPVAAVVNPNATLGIAAGSEVDLEVLAGEVMALEGGGHSIRHRLLIDPGVTILEPRHRELEAENGLTGRIGSTGKGIGAARADRVMRDAMTAGLAPEVLQPYGRVEPVMPALRRILNHGGQVQVEGSQGYGLGLHTAYYPTVTSCDCRAIDALAAVGVSPWAKYLGDLRVYVVMRPYPIRVAGNSGPLEGETSWEALGLPAEQTTVTKKTRRVGTWDPALAAAAIKANGGPSDAVRIALSMADHLDHAVYGTTDPVTLLKSEPVKGFLGRVLNDTRTPVSLVGTSDRTMVWLGE